MLKLRNSLFYNSVLSKNFITPQALMTIELITIELLATYALAHR